MILLFPLSYPYTIGKEDSFLSFELQKLKEEFKEIILFPTLIGNEKYIIDPSITINSQFGEYLAKKSSKFKYLFQFSFYLLFFTEVYQKPQVLLSFHKLRKLINYLINTLRAKSWLRKEIIQLIAVHKDKEILIYTYWFTFVTTALCHIFKDYSNIKIITRAHGIDIYEFRNQNYIPLRKFTINSLYRFYFVSEYARNYMIQKYPEYKHKYKTFPLSVGAQNNLNKLVPGNKYHFISCSTVDSNKRVNLICDALKSYAAENPEILIYWTHFGTGPLFDELKGKVRTGVGDNLFINLMGFQASKFIFEFYEAESINAFIITTSSEGGRPLSIQEALSFGIPVIATKIGGIPEIIDNNNGHLLSENPTIDEIKAAINVVIREEHAWNKKRELSYKTWEAKCNVKKLTNDFIEELYSI
jgi:glycosyltransferase involved in cell wall biosynthesis